MFYRIKTIFKMGDKFQNSLGIFIISMFEYGKLKALLRNELGRLTQIIVDN